VGTECPLPSKFFLILSKDKIMRIEMSDLCLTEIEEQVDDRTSVITDDVYCEISYRFRHISTSLMITIALMTE